MVSWVIGTNYFFMPQYQLQMGATTCMQQKCEAVYGYLCRTTLTSRWKLSGHFKVIFNGVELPHGALYYIRHDETEVKHVNEMYEEVFNDSFLYQFSSMFFNETLRSLWYLTICYVSENKTN